MKQFKGVIFDLDGVICHTDKFHYLAWKKLADELNVYFDEKSNDRFRGVSRMDCLEMLLADGNITATDEEKEALATRKNDYYKEYLKDMTPADLSEEVKNTLDTLRERGYLLAIGSSSKNTVFILNCLGLGDFFDKIADGNDIKRSKPDPEVFLTAAARLGLDPSECLVVEDAEAGIDAGTAGGMKTAGVGMAAAYAKTTYSMPSIGTLLDICE